jgi:hypothetical protein
MNDTCSFATDDGPLADSAPAQVPQESRSVSFAKDLVLER